jgi:hypothetical protein
MSFLPIIQILSLAQININAFSGFGVEKIFLEEILGKRMMGKSRDKKPCTTRYGVIVRNNM